MRERSLQRVIRRVANRRRRFRHAAIFGKWTQQLAIYDRRLIQTATARRNLSEEWVRNHLRQFVSQSLIGSRKLVPFEILRQHVNAVITDIADVEQIVVRKRVLDSKHP